MKTIVQPQLLGNKAGFFRENLNDAIEWKEVYLLSKKKEQTLSKLSLMLLRCLLTFQFSKTFAYEVTIKLFFYMCP